MNEPLSYEQTTGNELDAQRSTAVIEESPISESNAYMPQTRVVSRDSKAAAGDNQIAPNALFPDSELESFRSRWATVQTSFVDEPRAAVEQADTLVANVVERISEQFAKEREQLEKQWGKGEDVGTEDLRQALKRYRAFFDRLLAL